MIAGKGQPATGCTSGSVILERKGRRLGLNDKAIHSELSHHDGLLRDVLSKHVARGLSDAGADFAGFVLSNP